ncbi:zf-HC2 domain-containing protein [Streptomyces flavofungini]|uniref:zf-HC2 domain-containing protein n=1 Tax=Streptomyces flavofungini TaxID=68200 RepID=UPI0034DF3264
MSGSRANPAERPPADAEQHLGDRLAALVDGELGHDARERVLAHLATCPMCKTEADAQRRLKSVFAQAAPPPPSESFLARLQGLPAGGSEPPDGTRPPGDGEGFATGSSSAGLPRSGLFGASTESFAGYVPSGAHATVLPGEGRGFRIHDVTRHEGDRSLWRGRRFAFAAAGAVSMAAIALGGVTAGAPADTADPRAGGSKANSNVTPQRSQGAGASVTPDSVRRRGAGNPLSAQGRSPGVLAAPAAPVEVTGPLLPGAPAQPLRSRATAYAVTAPLLAGAATLSPLIRPPEPGPSGATPPTPPGVAASPQAESVQAGGVHAPDTTAAVPGADPSGRAPTLR